jgi:hypothetical protein
LSVQDNRARIVYRSWVGFGRRHIDRPARRKIGRKTFVDQKKFVVRRADLEFGIGNDSFALRRMIDKVTCIPVE